MSTPIFAIPELTTSQQNQYATSNEAFRYLEALMADYAVVDLSSGDVTLVNGLEAGEFNSAFLFRSSGNTVERDLTVPAQKRPFGVHNNGSAVLNVVRGSTSLSVPAGEAALFYLDGTANGLIAISSGIGGGGVGEQARTTEELTGNKTLSSADLGKDFYVLSTTSADIDLTIPSGLGNGFFCSFFHEGSGTFTVVEGGTTVSNPPGGTKIIPQGGYGSIEVFGSDALIKLFGVTTAA